jgi:hypothetical protein
VIGPASITQVTYFKSERLVQLGTTSLCLMLIQVLLDTLGI